MVRSLARNGGRRIRENPSRARSPAPGRGMSRPCRSVEVPSSSREMFDATAVGAAHDGRDRRGVADPLG